MQFTDFVGECFARFFQPGVSVEQGQMGAVAGTIFGGLILLAFSTEIGVQILSGFGLPDLYTLCGLA